MIELRSTSKQYGDTRQYIARIVGRDPKFTYQREFFGLKSGDVSTANVDDPGLYELGQINKKGEKNPVFRIVVIGSDGGLVSLQAGGDHADAKDADVIVMDLARRIGAGEAIADMVEIVSTPNGDKYRIRTKTASAKTVKANTVQSIIDRCWDLIGSLPDKEAKSVMSALRVMMRSETGENDNVVNKPPVNSARPK